MKWVSVKSGLWAISSGFVLLGSTLQRICRLGDMGLGQDWFIGISSGGGGAWWLNGGCLYIWGCLWVIGGTQIVTEAGWFQLLGAGCCLIL